ncbi:HNH endonuclease [Candidatus Poriferisodalis sp.]|uniref:HNH endonuclease n=1 Tax=Candidatus Poriferisodalis sp. TaxID=3101277 RepID=UPI003B5AF996
MPFIALGNLIGQMSPHRDFCAQCHADRSPGRQPSYQPDPFLGTHEHSKDMVALRRKAVSMRHHLSETEWTDEARAVVLLYLRWRDGQCCGVCGLMMMAQDAVIDHVIPKRFGVFDIRNGRAVAGVAYESKLHHIDNIQAAHERCRDDEGATDRVVLWRNLSLPLLPSAGRAQAVWTAPVWFPPQQ